MFVIDDAKFPPPRPANAATTMNVVYDESGRFITHSVSSVGMSSSSALTIVQLRPPNFAGATVYGMRIAAPTRVGTATR